MKIRAEGGLRIGTIHHREISAERFIRTLRDRAHCMPYRPPLRLEEAFASYGRIEFYVDGPAKIALERSANISRFVRNQQNGMSITNNLKDVLAGHKMTILFYEDGPIAVVSGIHGPKKAPEFTAPQVDVSSPSWRLAVHEVIVEETSRGQERSIPANLDEIELNIISGPKGQDILAQILMADGEYSPRTGEFVRAERDSNPDIFGEPDEEF